MATTMLSSTRLAQRTATPTAAPRPALRAAQLTRPAALRQVLVRADPKVCCLDITRVLEAEGYRWGPVTVVRG